jgi:salicylate hydroxylase
VRIAIIGAGLGGLTAAIALRRAGHEVRIYEQAPSLGDVGAGITITPNAWKGLASLGLNEALTRETDEVPQQAIRAHDSGAQIMAIERGRVTRDTYGAPYVMLHRADLHALLASEAGRENIELGATVEDANSLDADAVIAADGLKSVVRSKVFGNPPARFTGHVAWRGLVPANELPPEAAVPGSTVWAGPGRIFVRYPVRRGTLVNLVGLTRTDNWVAEGWSNRVCMADWLSQYGGWHDDVTSAIRATHDDSRIAWGLFTRDPLPTLIADRIALLGDAAHPMLPFMGQGAAMAIEDGVILGRAFAATSSVADAFALYERVRKPRTDWIQRESALGADRLQFEVAKTGLPPAETEDSLGIFHYDPATASLEDA